MKKNNGKCPTIIIQLVTAPKWEAHKMCHENEIKEGTRRISGVKISIFIQQIHFVIDNDKSIYRNLLTNLQCPTTIYVCM
jgi:hypothetical protein